MMSIRTAALAALVSTAALGSASDVQAAPGWTMLAGGLPEGMSLEGGAGFSRAPRVGFQYRVIEDLSLGAEFGFNYAGFTPDAAGGLSIEIQGALRRSWTHSDKLSIGTRIDIGVGIGAGDYSSAGLAWDICAVGLYGLTPSFWIGGMVDVPALILFPEGGTVGRVPILFGGAAELVINEQFHIGGKLGFGPSILVGGLGSTGFGMEIMALAAYRL